MRNISKQSARKIGRWRQERQKDLRGIGNRRGSLNPFLLFPQRPVFPTTWRRPLSFYGPPVNCSDRANARKRLRDPASLILYMTKELRKSQKRQELAKWDNILSLHRWLSFFHCKFSSLDEKLAYVLPKVVRDVWVLYTRKEDSLTCRFSSLVCWTVNVPSRVSTFVTRF